MKKLFKLAEQAQSAERLTEAAKAEIRKYLKRERAKPLPKGVHFWDFDCRLGGDQPSASAVHPAELFTAIDALLSKNPEQFYVELLAKDGVRTRMPPAWGEKDDFRGPTDEDFEN